MNIIQIDNWRDYRRDGEQFLHTATAAHEKKKRGFSTDTLYNVTCMAIEKLIMAFLMKNGDLAENHTMADLLRALQLHLGDIPELAEKLMYMDTFQEICSLDNFTIHIPSEEDVVKMLAIGEDVRAALQPYLYDEPTTLRQ
ncbi:HEPN domain-containing protein [Desulfopila sp. IMCC35006]|uniref:HEPN domain-containing protein n=1 Tax=Desulfopila sp. IMCC35006 TaxID=2569542 RepID=UPI0010AC884E|nr:HEPN domain-containing protein [Desulfopila sp. IMCC35006]TKB24377.1 HEPN domain-containing protein [Desulfopila sp. IMCC35006]